mmetsp:Transcript_3142/g.10375  ORF Transcript_3142/g.10375 Transcript_3142/m.10375 type:complete len:311 (-) Transcript_3142:125-1057(-)
MGRGGGGAEVEVRVRVAEALGPCAARKDEDPVPRAAQGAVHVQRGLHEGVRAVGHHHAALGRREHRLGDRLPVRIVHLEGVLGHQGRHGPCDVHAAQNARGGGLGAELKGVALGRPRVVLVDGAAAGEVEDALGALAGHGRRALPRRHGRRGERVPWLRPPGPSPRPVRGPPGAPHAHVPRVLAPVRGHVHRNGPPVEREAVQVAPGLLGAGGVLELDEAEAPRLPRVVVSREIHVHDGAVLLEAAADVGGEGAAREVADEERGAVGQVGLAAHLRRLRGGTAALERHARGLEGEGSPVLEGVAQDALGG